jgi:Beta/Gamma crystallin/PQQ enzyme repeat
MADRFHQLILFENTTFSGSHKHIFRSIADLSSFGGTSSFFVSSGSWKLFRKSQFQDAYGSVFAPRVGGYGWVGDYQVDNDSVSAVRLVGDEPRQVPHLVLFRNLSFKGDHKHLFGEFTTGGGWGGAKSLVIFAGTWSFQLANGTTTKLGPGLYPTASQVLSASVQALGIFDATTPDPGIPHAILFENAGFEGGHRHVLQDMSSLGDLGWGVSAIAVERGAWRIFSKENFNSPQGQPLTRGIYPYVDDYDIQNDRAASIKLMPIPGSPPPLVSTANMNDGSNAYTAHGDSYRLGWNAHETHLTPANVRVPDFGLLWRRNDILGQDGKPSRVYGQPLYVSAAQGGLSRDVVIIATASNDVVALDANDGSTVWKVHVGGAGNAMTVDEFNVPLTWGWSSGPCKNTNPLHGVNGTPVVVHVGGKPVVYVCFLATVGSDSTASVENDWNQGYFLQAIDVGTGHPPPFFPAPIPLEGSYTHPDGKVVRFRPYMHTQRGALTYFEGAFGDGARGWILATFSSRCDYFGKAKDEDWQGWIIGVQATLRPGEPVLFASSTNEFHAEGCGGIWGTAGIAVDDDLRMYAVSGNGKFDGKEKWADSVLKLADLQSVLDSYTARDWNWMFDNDTDLGSCSTVLLPPIQTTLAAAGAAPSTLNVIATGGKDGRVYLVNADDLGQVGGALWRQRIFSSGAQLYSCGIGVTPAYFDGGSAGKYLYYCSASDAPHRGMVAIQFDDIEGEGQFGLRVIQFEGRRLNGAPGTPFVSSNGARDAVVWVVESNRFEDDDGGDSVLHAWNAVTGELLYSSPRTAAQNLGDGRKFSSIAVLKGKVLVGATSIACYGLKREDL